MKTTNQQIGNNMITVLIIAPDSEPCVKQVPRDWQALCELVGGPFADIYPFKDSAAILCNKDGMFVNLVSRRPRVFIRGTFVVVGAEREKGDFTSLSDELIQKYSAFFRNQGAKGFICREKGVVIKTI